MKKKLLLMLLTVVLCLLPLGALASSESTATVILRANNGTGDEMVYTHTAPCRFIFPENPFTVPEGHTLFRWENRLSGQTYQPGHRLDLLPDTTTYIDADWKTSVQITYHANDSTGAAHSQLHHSVTTEPHFATEKLSSYELPECPFDAPAGKVFYGWATEPNGPVLYPDAVEFPLLKSVTRLDLYAVWGTPGTGQYPNCRTEKRKDLK